MIEFRDLQKYYGSCMALDIPYLAFAEGGCTAVLGVNGSGKSTLLRILMEEFGRKGRDGIWKAGYLPQHPYGFRCSVRKNVELAIWETERVRRAESALDALRQVGIGHLADKKGCALSGGETQRMALARLMVQDNQVLLLDEPTAACDIAGNDRIEQMLKTWPGTVIFSTHSPAQAMRLSDRMIFLHQGKLTECGDTAQVFHAPKSPQFQDYLTYWRF